jgi:multiple sugar transport system permease protein
MAMNKKKRMIEKTLLLYIPLVIMLVFIMTPFLWALLISFKSKTEIIGMDIKLFPESFSLLNYISVWKKSNFSLYFQNSLYTSILSLFFIVVISIMNGYVLSRFKFKGKKAFMLMLIGTQIMPVILMIIPLFVIFNQLHLTNNRWSLIIFFVARQIPFNSIMMKGFVSGIPISLEEAAWVDGASRFKTLVKIVIPMLLPGIVATGAFAFVSCWNEFMISFSFITNPKLFTIPVALKYMIGEFSVDYGSLAAGSIIALIIPVLLFAYIQKFLINGLGAGAVKG